VGPRPCDQDASSWNRHRIDAARKIKRRTSSTAARGLSFEIQSRMRLDRRRRLRRHNLHKVGCAGSATKNPLLNSYRAYSLRGFGSACLRRTSSLLVPLADTTLSSSIHQHQYLLPVFPGVRLSVKVQHAAIKDRFPCSFGSCGLCITIRQNPELALIKLNHRPFIALINSPNAPIR